MLYEPDAIGDLIYTGVASRVLRTGLANGLQADAGYQLNDSHTLRAGVSYTRETLNNSSDSLTFTADAGGNQLSTSPIALSDRSRKITNQVGLYLQDEWKLNDKLTLNYGARADWINAYVSASQLSPRKAMSRRRRASVPISTCIAPWFCRTCFQMTRWPGDACFTSAWGRLACTMPMAWRASSLRSACTRRRRARR